MQVLRVIFNTHTLVESDTGRSAATSGRPDSGGRIKRSRRTLRPARRPPGTTGGSIGVTAIWDSQYATGVLRLPGALTDVDLIQRLLDYSQGLSYGPQSGQATFLRWGLVEAEDAVDASFEARLGQTLFNALFESNPELYRLLDRFSRTAANQYVLTLSGLSLNVEYSYRA